ncbi:MAG: aryl-sulfate sulfotransferase [Gemmatimonadota bacterium]
MTVARAGLLRVGLLAGLVLAGCDGPAGPVTPAIISVQSAEAGPLVHALDIVLEHAAPLSIEYTTADAPLLRVSSPTALEHRVVLTGLRAGRTYEYSIAGTSHDGTFATQALPADLDSIGFDATGAPTSTATLIHVVGHGGFRGYVVVDGGGEVIWYWRSEGFPYGMTRRGNGNFVFLDGGRGLVEVGIDGHVVRRLPQDPDRSMHHDVIATPQNTLLVIAHDRRSYGSGSLDGEAIWEWSPESGLLVKRWSSWDQLSPETDRGPRFGQEWLHANALALGPAGNVLLSVHYLNQVISLTPAMDGIEWRLGGVNATIASGAPFSGQHTARELAPGRILLFDNGVDRGGPSRALELEVSGASASSDWEWQAPTANFASAVGSARRLSNGNTVVAFGMSEGLSGSTGPVEIYEVTRDELVVWRMVLHNVRVMYRAEPLPSLAGEEPG